MTIVKDYSPLESRPWLVLPVQIRRILRLLAMGFVSVLILGFLDWLTGTDIYQSYPLAAAYVVASLTAFQEVIHREMFPATPDAEKPVVVLEPDDVYLRGEGDGE